MSFSDSPALAIQVRGASKTYANGTRALEPVDLSVREGEFVTIIGPSGCGKSTLLRVIAGLAAPTSGDVVLAHGFSSSALAYVFQSPTLMPWATLQANVRLPLDLSGVPRMQADDTTGRALRQVGLHDFASSFPRELSGGMQMRASIARALVTGARLLLMDEPFGALDEITRHRLDTEFAELSTREGLTVLFVTHSIYEAVFLSSRVLVMSSRPGAISGEISIDLPRPRADTFRGTAEFAAYGAKLSRMLAGAMQEEPT